MNASRLSVSMIIASIGLGGALLSWAGNTPALAQDKDKAKPAKETQRATPKDPEAPAAVKDEAKKFFGDREIKYVREKTDEQTWWNATGHTGATKVTLKMTPDGKIGKYERGVSWEDMPLEVRKGIRKFYPEATVISHNDIELHYYEILIKDGKEQRVVRINKNGLLWKADRDLGPSDPNKS